MISLTWVRGSLGTKPCQLEIGLPTSHSAAVPLDASGIQSSSTRPQSGGITRISVNETPENGPRDDMGLQEAPRHTSNKLYSNKLVDVLRVDLNKALVVSASKESGKFLPVSSLKDILTTSRIIETVCETFEDQVSKILESMLHRDSARQSIKIYAMLILIGKLREMEKFVDGQITDKDLPIPLMIQEPADASVQDLHGDKVSNMRGSLSFLQDWDYTEIDLFDSYQWYFLSPHFSQHSDENILHYSLQDKITLPWTGMSNRIEAGFSVVHKVKIHPSNHDFSNSDVLPPALVILMCANVY